MSQQSRHPEIGIKARGLRIKIQRLGEQGLESVLRKIMRLLHKETRTQGLPIKIFNRTKPQPNLAIYFTTLTNLREKNNLSIAIDGF